MGFIGAVEVKDGSSCTGPKLTVHEDGSIDTNLVSGPVDVSVPEASGGATTAVAAGTTGATELLGVNPDRLSFMVTNRGAAEVFLGFGNSNADLTSGYPIAAGGVFLPPPGIRWTGKVKVISVAGGENLRVVEFEL